MSEWDVCLSVLFSYPLRPTEVSTTAPLINTLSSCFVTLENNCLSFRVHSSRESGLLVFSDITCVYSRYRSLGAPIAWFPQFALDAESTILNIRFPTTDVAIVVAKVSRISPVDTTSAGKVSFLHDSSV